MMEMIERLRDLESIVANLFRVGTVSSINEEAATARVTFSDRDNVVSYDLPVITKNTLKNKDYWMPDVEEQVLCLFLPIGIETGFIVGGYYDTKTEKPAATGNKRAAEFEDGTRVEYDREAHKLQIDIPETAGTVVINCAGSVTVNSPKIDLGESADLEPSVLGDKLAAALDDLRAELDNHQHIGNLGAPTSPALQVKPFEFIRLWLVGANYWAPGLNG